MFKNIENLKIENIHKGISKSHSSITSRKSSSFILRTAGCMRYDFSGNIFDVPAGHLIFLPKGSTYNYTTISDTPCEYMSINFLADITDWEPFCYSLENFHELEEFRSNLSDLWKFGRQAEHYRCYSFFYTLLAYLDTLENQTYIDKNKLSIISPAVTYLKEHIYDCDLKAETLPMLCGISGTYFRKIFQLNYGTSPQKYILSKRLSHAKAVIDNGDYVSISKVAASVGYTDPLYFSRAFKKKYGISPTQYAKE